MSPEPSPRGVRVGGVTIEPGHARSVSIALPGEPGRAIPAWVAVGAKAGPRVTIVAAERGYEVTAALAANEVVTGLSPTWLAGSVVVVPVLRPGGLFAPNGRPRPGWTFPGDAGGGRRAREAFIAFSELVVGSAVLLTLSSPPPGRRGILSVRGALNDPRVRRLAFRSGARVAVMRPNRPGSLLAAAADAGVAAFELRGAGPAGHEAPDAEDLSAAVRSVLVAAGVFAPGAEPAPEPRPMLAPAIVEPQAVKAPGGGLLQAVVSAGQLVGKGTPLARIVPPLGGPPLNVVAPCRGLVVESTVRSAARPGAPLFVLGELSRTVAQALAVRAGHPTPATPKAARRAGRNLRVGWVEHVSLPGLGINRLRAKIDTGARTSALHVTRMRTVDTTSGPHRRPILEIVVPAGGARGRALTLRATVREYVLVRDTSGRRERRPVIEAMLELGPLRRRIAITLTNRADMLFPMLIGRTALGPDLIVDPSRRYLLSGP